MAQPHETPSRLNSFFTHLNHDIRHIIYDFLDLPPISVSSLGLVLCCQQALLETKPAAAQQLKRRLAAAEAMARKEGRHFFIPKTEDKLEYVSLGRIEIVACFDRYTMASKGIHMLLGCCFSKIKFVCLSQADYQAAVLLHKPEEASQLVREKSTWGSYFYQGATDYLKAAHAIGELMWVIEAYQPGQRRDNTNAIPCIIECPVRTKTVQITWGTLSPKYLDDFEGFEILEVPEGKYLIGRGVRASCGAYTGSILREICYEGGQAGSLNLASGARWPNGIDKSAFVQAWSKEKEQQAWICKWQDTPSDLA